MATNTQHILHYVHALLQKKKNGYFAAEPRKNTVATNADIVEG